MTKLTTLQSLLGRIVTSRESDFYRKIWGTAYRGKFNELPAVTVNDFLHTPLEHRMYRHDKGLVKIIKRTPIQFLIQRSLAELKEEGYGITGERPTVLFEDPHESLEKTLWCYERGVLPAIGEHANLSISSFLIDRYKSDSLLCDCVILEKLLTHSAAISSHINVFNIIDNNFKFEKLRKLALPHKLNCILGLPETGAFASSCKEHLEKGELVFHPNENSIIEFNKTIIVTKLILMPTPIIRYVTGISFVLRAHTCNCKEDISFSLV
ncbi:hypothetical protein HYW58_02160 [Candidatus Kaiserbacteria bacterium]|nr:hypothetical protein [Candidatus Kaiserbacteria bacterium]